LTALHAADDTRTIARRLFTPEQANAALPQVRPLVERLVERRADLLAARARQAEVAAHVGGNGGGLDPAVPAALAAAAAEAETGLHEAVGALHELGVLVKDLDAGLVDFPAEREDGEEVLLCWQLGEDSVEWWHRPDDGFAGRRPLAEL
jgi:hypothetical protein